MTDTSKSIIYVPCVVGHERCAVDGVECECERVEWERGQHERSLDEMDDDSEKRDD